jgi:hypothetical protein
MSHQLGVTVMADVRSGLVPEARRVLRSFSTGHAFTGPLALGKISTVHFARLFLLEETTDLEGRALPGRLVFMSDIDAPLGGYLRDLVELGGDALDRIFECCEGYPTRPVTNDDRIAFLREHMVDPAAMYVNTVGRTVEQVHRDNELRDAIEDYLDRPDVDVTRLRSAEAHSRIRTYVESEESLRWATRGHSGPTLRWRVGETLHLVGVPLLLLVLLPILVVVVPVWIVLLRLRELRDKAANEKPDERRVQELTALEDHVVQTHPRAWSGSGTRLWSTCCFGIIRSSSRPFAESRTDSVPGTESVDDPTSLGCVTGAPRVDVPPSVEESGLGTRTVRRS